MHVAGMLLVQALLLSPILLADQLASGTRITRDTPNPSSPNATLTTAQGNVTAGGDATYQSKRTVVSNVTAESNNVTDRNVTCGENEEYCVETASCSRPYYACNGCPRTSVKCGDGRCVPIAFYVLQRCSQCYTWEVECPDGRCYDGLYFNGVCPPCAESQVTCGDGSCAPRREECTSCPSGQKRCADMSCIGKDEVCGKPCFSHQVHCSRERACRDDYRACVCGTPDYVPCPDGSCRYSSCQANPDRGYPLPFDPINFIGFVVCVLMVPCLVISRRYYQKRRLQEIESELRRVEMQGGELRGLETSLRRGENASSPPPVTTQPTANTPLLEPVPPPSYEAATLPPPPPYSEHYAQPDLSATSPLYSPSPNTAPPYTPRAQNTNTETQSYSVEPPAVDAVGHGHNVEGRGNDVEGQVHGSDVRHDAEGQGLDVGGQSQDVESQGHDVEGHKFEGEGHDAVSQSRDTGNEREAVLRTIPKEQGTR